MFIGNWNFEVGAIVRKEDAQTEGDEQRIDAERVGREPCPFHQYNREEHQPEQAVDDSEIPIITPGDRATIEYTKLPLEYVSLNPEQPEDPRERSEQTVTPVQSIPSAQEPDQEQGNPSRQGPVSEIIVKHILADDLEVLRVEKIDPERGFQKIAQE